MRLSVKLSVIVGSDAEANSLNPNNVKTLLANGVSTSFINGMSTFINRPKNLPRNPSSFKSWVFDNFILADELFTKAWWSLATCMSDKINLCGKLVSSLELPIIFGGRFNVTLVLFLIPELPILVY